MSIWMSVDTWTDLFLLEDEEWNTIEPLLQDVVIELVMRRAEHLSSVGAWNEAEKCARFVFSKRAGDVVITGRAARYVRRMAHAVATKRLAFCRCCRAHIPENKTLIWTANAIEKAVLKMQVRVTWCTFMNEAGSNWCSVVRSSHPCR